MNVAGPRPRRLVSLDAFRGLTIALMILVNNPGSWAHIHAPLRHAHWHGWTPTDLVFPFFLFIVGVAMALSFQRRGEQGADAASLRRKVLWRSLWIFVCGLLLNFYPFGLPLSSQAVAGFSLDSVAQSLGNLRVLGVLQRIALCYLAVGLFVAGRPGGKAQMVFGATAVGLYEILMRVPLVSGWGAGSFSLETNFVRWLDLQLLGADHLWNGAGVPFDPEGLLSTLTAAVTTLAGYRVGRFLLPAGEDLKGRIGPLARTGAALALAGLLLGRFEPINKQLWSFSYTLLTAGLAMVCLAATIRLVDIHRGRRWARPFVVYGSNPLVVFVGSGLLARTLGRMRVGDAEQAPSVQRWLYLHVFQPLGGEVNGSLLQAVAHAGLWLAILWWLYRRRIFLKI